MASSRKVSQVAVLFTGWTERWVPDAFVFALIATVLAVLAGLLVSSSQPMLVVDSWGKGFWELLPFTLQMALVIITGYVVASTRPVFWLIGRLADLPKSPKGAVALVALFAMLSAWFNWGFSLIFSAILAKEVARRVKDADYRALAAASFLGLGSIWAQGLSGSAALQMASPGALQPAIREVVSHGGQVREGLIPLTHTIFLWQSLVSVAVEVWVVLALVWWMAPSGPRAVPAQRLGIELEPLVQPAPAKPKVPGEWLEHRPHLTVLIVLLGGVYLVRYFATSRQGLSGITLNTLNLFFLLLGFALHGTPARLMRAVKDATPAVWGVLLQFPFYAGIAGIITGTRLNHHLAHFFVSVATRTTFPAVIAIYSAVLGVFVPSGGSKWVIEAPYVMAAAHELHVHLGWTVACYDLGEALANLVQPFWMLPNLALLGLKARDVMGYTLLVFVVLLPVVLIQVTVLGLSLAYPL